MHLKPPLSSENIQGKNIFCFIICIIPSSINTSRRKSNINYDISRGGSEGSEGLIVRLGELKEILNKSWLITLLGHS